VNQVDLIKNFITKGMTPKGIVKNMTKNNPIFSNLIDMAEKGDNKGVETFARNLLKEKGMDFDKEMANLKNRLGIN